MEDHGRVPESILLMIMLFYLEYGGVFSLAFLVGRSHQKYSILYTSRTTLSHNPLATSLYYPIGHYQLVSQVRPLLEEIHI